jgi:hypothetical protein
MSTNPQDLLADGVLEKKEGKDVLRFERHLAHPIERVWAALTEPGELVGWWGEAEKPAATSTACCAGNCTPTATARC